MSYIRPIILDFEGRQEFEKKYKDILVPKFTFRTDYCQFEKEFGHMTIRYYVTQSYFKNGKEIPTEIVKYKIHFFQGLSCGKDFIREHFNDMDWNDICCHVKLKEKFMREYKDFLNWKLVCKYQKLSTDFVREMKKYTKKYIKNYEQTRKHR